MIRAQDQIERLQQCMNIEAENDRLKDNLARMFDDLGVLRNCRVCKKPVWWIFQSRSDRYLTYDSDGTAHRITCLKRNSPQEQAG